MAAPAPVTPAGLPLTERLHGILSFAVEHGASDVHVTVGVAPVVRIDGQLRSIPKGVAYGPEAAAEDVLATLTAAQRERFTAARELDYSFPFGSVRVRANAFLERGKMAAAFRIIPAAIRSPEELGVPPIVSELMNQKQGLLIITGPTGHGKSTTLASLVEEVNRTRSEHIVTIEDPIEYLFAHQRSVIVQRELGGDTESFAAALRSSVRQDPNVLLVGEMRDRETMEAALTLAETGHLILTTLHTSSAAHTADRIIDSFPPHQQPQARSQLAGTLLGVVSQRLIPKVTGGRALAAEVLIATPAVRTLIRDGKTHQLENLIQTGTADGMINLDVVLAGLVSQGQITIDDAVLWANDPKQLKMSVY